jgi:excisionase family DNA binding protein
MSLDDLDAEATRVVERAKFTLGSASRRARRAEPRIVDPSTHPRRVVCLAVAAEFLGLDERTVRARIEVGELDAERDGKVYRIRVDALVAYVSRRASA